MDDTNIAKELEFLKSLDISVSRIKPSEFAEQNRVMASGESRWEGPYSFDITPYLREVVDCLSPDCPAIEISVMKGAQIGFSTGVLENGIIWIISQYPGNILLMAADDDAVKLAMEQKIDPAINSAGIGHLIGAKKAASRKSGRTGDTQKGKEFVGGRIYMHSVKNPKKMRQFSAKYGFLDDLDSAKLADKKEGSLMRLVGARFMTFGNTRKQFNISTPTTKQDSIIEREYLKGDQRKWFVPCPHCGEYQELEWSVDVSKDIVKSGKAGIKYQLKEGTNTVIPESVVYVCRHCGEDIDERHKYSMNLAGEWRPTAEPKVIGHRSYHISALYAPPGAYDWAKQAQEWADCWPPERQGKPNIANLQAFKNLVLGQTFDDRGRANDIIQLATNCRDHYQAGTVPSKLSVEDGQGDIVLITIACDLNGTVDDARLDYTVVGWAETGTSYAIDHGSIGTYNGRATKKDDEREIMSYQNGVPNSVWDRFYNDVVIKEWPTDDGDAMQASITVVDTGYHTIYANAFINSDPFILGVKGYKGEEWTSFDSATPLFKPSQDDPKLYLLEVNKIKDRLADRIDLVWRGRDQDPPGPMPEGFMNFPQMGMGKFDIKFFRQYAGEVKRYKYNDDGSRVASRWTKRHASSQNHFWDVEVYNMAARDIFVKLVCEAEGIKKATWYTLINEVLKK